MTDKRKNGETTRVVLSRKIEKLGENPFPVPLSPPSTSCALAWRLMVQALARSSTKWRW